MKRNLPSFRRKITRGIFIVALINILFIVAVITVLRPALIDNLTAGYLSNLGDFISDDIQYVLLVQDPVSTQEYLDNIHKFPWIQSVSLYSPEGVLNYQAGESNWSPSKEELASSSNVHTVGAFTHSIESIEITNDANQQEIGAILHASVDGSALIEQVNRAFYWIILALFVGSIVIWLLTRYIAGRASRTVALLNDQIVSVDPESDGDRRIIIDADSRELQNVETGINALLERIFDYQALLESRVEKRTEELANALEANSVAEAVRTSLIMNLSHDLKTPLTSNMGYLDHAIELLEDSPGDIEDILSSLQRSRHYCLVLSGEINTLLQYSSSTEDDDEIVFDTFDIEELTNKCIESTKLLAVTSRNAVIYEHSGDTFIHSSTRLIQHILDNLIANSHKYCTDGNVWIETSVDDEKGLTLVVADNGVGIPTDEKELIFDRHFQSTNTSHLGPKGMGIGLSLTKFWVDKLGGSISVESSPDEKTVFTVFLPSEK